MFSFGGNFLHAVLHMPIQLKVASNLCFKRYSFFPSCQSSCKPQEVFPVLPRFQGTQSTIFYHCIKANVESVQVVSNETSNTECNTEAPVQSKLQQITNYSHAWVSLAWRHMAAVEVKLQAVFTVQQYGHLHTPNALIRVKTAPSTNRWEG